MTNKLFVPQARPLRTVVVRGYGIANESKSLSMFLNTEWTQKTFSYVFMNDWPQEIEKLQYSLYNIRLLFRFSYSRLLVNTFSSNCQLSAENGNQATGNLHRPVLFQRS